MYDSLPARGVFSSLSDEALLTLAGYGEFIRAPEGTRVVEQDYFQDSLYFLLYGELRVFYITDDERNHIATIREGETVGEANLFSPADATASVYVSQDCEVWRIDKDQISKFIIAYPRNGLAMIAEIIGLLSTRIKKLNRRASHALDFYTEHCRELAD